MKKAISILLTMAMILALSVSAVAASTGNVTVDGHIGTTGDPTPGFDITFTTGVYWWVTQAAPTTVVDGDSSGPNPSVVNMIENNAAATQIEVSFDAFALANADANNATMQAALILNLTGALSADTVGILDLSTGYSAPSITYTALLDSGPTNVWKYGFGGTYSAPLSATPYIPQYTMTLGFAFA